jgi:hypothetical protein
MPSVGGRFTSEGSRARPSATTASSSAAPLPRRYRSSRPRTRARSASLRGGRWAIDTIGRSAITVRTGRSTSRALASRQAARHWATPAERPRSDRASLIRHHTVVGSGGWA